MGGACNMDGRDGNAYKILVGKLEGITQLWRLKLDGKITILRDKRMGTCEMDSLVQGREQWQTVVNKLMKLRVP
jgi:hypothetical protein